MIEKIKLKNFRAYKDQEIEFDKGVNSIIGSSDQGKSTILRSLYWAFQNRPLGKRMVSNWNRDKKGEPKEETSVEVFFNNGNFKRVLTKDFNGYHHGKKESEALKGMVPESCLQLLNFSEVNIQKQHDNLFMIADSAGQTARLLNRVLNLEIIETVLQRAESTKRNFKKEIAYKTDDLAEEKKKLVGLKWLDKAEKLSNKVQKVAERVESKESEISELEKIISEISETQKKQNTFVKLEKSDGIVKKAEKAFLLQQQHTALISELESLIVNISEAQEEKENFSFVMKAEKKMAEISEAVERNIDDEEKYSQLSTLLLAYKASCKMLSEKEVILSELTKQLPKICPLCGGKI